MQRENRSGLFVLFAAVTAMLFAFPPAFGAEVSSTAAGDRQQELVGTWVTVINGRELEMVLNADGSMTFVGNNWTYTTGPGKLYVDTGEGTVEYDIQLSGDRLAISGGDIDGSMEFTRKGGGMAGGQQTQGPSIFGQAQTQQQQQTGGQAPNLVGTWVTAVNGQEVEMVFNADGSMTFVGNNWNYTAAPGKLTVHTASGSVDYNLQFSGDKFVLSGGDITGSMEFTRKSGGGMTGQQQGQGPSLLGKPQTQQQQTGGQAPNLVGTWVTMVNGQEVEMVFSADGSMTFVGNNWNYTAAPGKLTVHTASGPVDYNLQFSGDSFTLSGGDIEGSVEFTRKSGGGMTGGQTQGGMFGKQEGGQQAATGGAITPEALAGYWTAEYNDQTFELWFDEGGYMDFNDQTWSYTVSGNQLIVDTGMQKITYNIKLSGDTLVISGGDTPGPITFIRSEY
jgi:hypothetical protein